MRKEPARRRALRPCARTAVLRSIVTDPLVTLYRKGSRTSRDSSLLGQRCSARVAAALALLVAALVATTPASARLEQLAAVDLTVTNVEVTQATQTTTNSIRLVARRATAVRATVGVSGAAGPVSGITGELHVFVNGTEVTPTTGVPPINAPFTAPVSPQRNNENDTLNFELLAPTGITASTDVDFVVNVDPIPGEANTANNSRAVNDRTAVNRRTPFLFFTRIDYTPSGLGLPPLAAVQAGIGDAFVRGILPVDDSDPALYRQGIFPTLTWTEDANGDGILDALGADGNNLLTFLESCRQLIVNSGVGASDRIFLYGWINGNPIDGNGLASVGGRVGFGNTQASRYQRSYAHELTHNFGLNHNSRGLDEVGWDVGARLVNNPSTNNTTGRVKPIITAVTGPFFDIQNAGRLTNEAWVDTTTYNFLLSHSTLQPGPSPDLRVKVAYLQGIFDPSGSELVQLNPVFRFPWRSQPSRSARRGQFVARVTDTAGVTTNVRFRARVADDPRREKEMNGAFSVLVPVNPNADIASLRVTNRAGDLVFAERRLSEPPRIAILSPEPGAVLGRRTTVEWAVDDSDTPPDEMMFQAAYSRNKGRSWVPIGVNIRGDVTSFTFNSRQIRRSAGNGVIRVFVSDGLNTAFADVTGLTR
jgi:hypothetical protein